MNRSLLLLPLLLSSCLALTCYKCASFPADMTADATELIGKVLTALNVENCNDTTQELKEVCTSSQDECHLIEVSSKLGGEISYDGQLYQCGTSVGRPTLCDTYTLLASTQGVELAECAVEGCTTDTCFEAVSGSTATTSSAWLPVLVLALSYHALRDDVL